MSALAWDGAQPPLDVSLDAPWIHPGYAHILSSGTPPFGIDSTAMDVWYD